MRQHRYAVDVLYGGYRRRTVFLMAPSEKWARAFAVAGHNDAVHGRAEVLAIRHARPEEKDEVTMSKMTLRPARGT